MCEHILQPCAFIGSVYDMCGIVFSLDDNLMCRSFASSLGSQVCA